jgi:hypothetical protein
MSDDLAPFRKAIIGCECFRLDNRENKKESDEKRSFTD